MTREGTLPLDSYRLAAYSVQVPCYICGEGNTYDAEVCRYCFAPMALAHQSGSQKVAPQMIAAIGASGAGKTVYLGMLIDMLSRQASGLQLLARGAFSITLQQTTIGALGRCEFPNKTPNEPDRWNWVHCQVRVPRRKRPVELIMPDMAGDALFEEVDHPRSYPVIRAFLEKCAGVMILIDTLKLYDGTFDQDYFTMKLLSYLNELDDDARTGWQNRPIAMIFSKADQRDEPFVDPAAFGQAHTPGLWQHCSERFHNHAFFASGVAGACAMRYERAEGHIRVPLRVEPRGILEPFEWLIGRLNA